MAAGARWWVALTVVVAVAVGRAGHARAAPSKVLRDLACTSCHLDGSPTRFMYESFEAFSKAPPPAPTGCVQCHVSNTVAAAPGKPPAWLPLTAGMIDRIRQFHAYVAAPALTTRVELPGPSGKRAPLARFTACGLERFLASPLPRHRSGQQSMFPVEPTRLRTLMTALGPELEPCGDAGSAAQIARGRELFDQLACSGCHAGTGQGPRLRLGIPLLGRAFFRARVKLGAGTSAAPQIWQRGWQAQHGQLVPRLTDAVVMPPHPDVTEADLDALYAYVAADRSDIPAATPVRRVDRVDVPDSIRMSLFREVQKRVFDTSCRHCHSPEARDQRLIETVFGEVPNAAPVELPMTRLAVSPSATLRRVLSPGPGCSDSPLLARLKARADEWSGHAVASAPRGMPMTLPPVDGDAVRMVAVWSAVGCPSDRGDLCEPCAGPSPPPVPTTR